MKKELIDTSAVRTVDDILTLALKEGVADVHFEPRSSEMVVRMRVDGVLRHVMTVENALRDKVILRLKVLAGMDLTERRKPQDGRASFSANTDLRLSTLPTVYGEKVVLRILDRTARAGGAEELGIEGENLRRYRELLKSPEGLVLIAGPSGSGKSSTMYEMLTELAREEINIVTLEDPVEYIVVGANQVAIKEDVGMTFSLGMRAALRQDPDVIAIGEIRDAQTAQIAYRAAVTGHLTFATLHARCAAALPDRLDDIDMEIEKMTGTLRGVVVQRLVRRICVHCRGTGCERCGGTGFRGRVGVFGIASFLDGAPITVERLREADTALQENCRALIAHGVTSESEVKRVIGKTAYAKT